MKPVPRVLSKEEFLAMAHEDDDLTVTIRGHQAVEGALNAAISEALFEPHALEIERLSFSLKIDLAIALRALSSDLRPLFSFLNRIRNRFAHEASAVFCQSDANDLRNCVPLRQRASVESTQAEYSPQDLLRLGIAVAFIEARGAYDNLRTVKIEQEVMHELVEEELAGWRPDRRRLDEVLGEIAERVARKKSRTRLDP